ncbi:peptidoglycan-binding protein [Planomonospora sp. ID91781]|uniref:peptidoglycan-binding domain-containing protein n=1 Tax=Planomonospora sp. ID91781 TaxID=2738135 RepID=UPI0018C37E89|nr:peptidoglycan-binding protein [Planomonospora sp. ID91781]
MARCDEQAHRSWAHCAADPLQEANDLHGYPDRQARSRLPDPSRYRRHGVRSADGDAVKVFQRAARIEVDGRVGRQTWTVLLHVA